MAYKLISETGGSPWLQPTTNATMRYDDKPSRLGRPRDKPAGLIRKAVASFPSSGALFHGAARDALDEPVEEEIVGDRHRDARDQRCAHQFTPVINYR